jgi:hypothetical protein
MLSALPTENGGADICDLECGISFRPFFPTSSQQQGLTEAYTTIQTQQKD